MRRWSGGKPDHRARTVPAGGFAGRSRAVSDISLPALRPACEVLAVTWAGAGGRPPPPTGARAVKHGPRSHLGMRESQGQSRGGTPEGERTLQGARRNASCGGYGLRLTAFRILLFVSLIRRWRNGPVIVTEKPVPPPGLSVGHRGSIGERRIAKSRVANGAFSIATHDSPLATSKPRAPRRAARTRVFVITPRNDKANRKGTTWTMPNSACCRPC